MSKITSSALRQRGAASLIVVMVLFFVISMVAAYTNRNLIFEQKTAANQQRSTRALEAADAGIEWALTMLNTGRITGSCATSTLVTDTDFRQRYLVIDAANGNITPNKRSDTTLADRDLYPTCVYTGTGWSCSCPVDGDPSLTPPTGGEIYPAFRVRFRRVCAVATAPDSACTTPTQPQIVHIDVNACTKLSEDCLRFDPAPAAVAGEGRATVHVVAALRSGLVSAPTAALTARGTVNIGVLSLPVTNSEVTGSGLTIQSGGDLTGTYGQLQGKAGTPRDQTFFKLDTKLSGLSDLVGPPPRTAKELFFANTFGIWPTTFRDQPAAIDFDCTTSCNAANLRTRVALNPGRVFWVRGNLAIDSAGDIGSAASPVLLNVTGSVTFSTPVNVYGLIYSQADTWTVTGGGSIFGAAVAETNFDGSGATTGIVYNSAILTRLRTITGSFVRVPGTWKDFES